jgi:hypothetical protein
MIRKATYVLLLTCLGLFQSLHAQQTLPTKKVSVSDGVRSLEFNPSGKISNTFMIEPVNLSTQKGLTTAFYIKDTASWKFYTNDSVRLSINGTGAITTSAPLLVNNANPDERAKLRVKGNVRIDSSLIIRSESDDDAFISINRDVKSAFEPYDSINAYTVTPTAWNNGKNIPVFRIRHPLNVTSLNNRNSSIDRDFKILPYEFGMAIEYNGVVENWVGEWSIHKGVNYYDMEGTGNGWGAVLWVGDDLDAGGVRSTARNNLSSGGNVNYGEISVERFSGAPNGDFHFRLPSNNNRFDFIYGARGSNNAIASIKNDGLVLPKTGATSFIPNPEKAQLAYDSSDNKVKYYNGNRWISVDGSVRGKSTQSSNGTLLIYKIPHELGTAPGYFNVIATSAAAANISYINADNQDLIIYYTTPPPAGPKNLSWNWFVQP